MVFFRERLSMARNLTDRSRLTLIVSCFAAVCLAAFMTAQAGPQAGGSSGRTLYINTCSACHGTDGTGAPAASVGFDVPLPDFSDCSFASREPDGDWSWVVREGGPARGFSEIMPEFGDALSDDEIQSVLDHVRTFCGDDAWPRGDLNLPRALKTTKAFPEDEMVLSAAVEPDEPGAMEYKLIWEKRFGARNQIEIIVPFGSTEQPTADGGTAWKSSLGDIGVAYKRVLFSSHSKGSIVSVAGEMFFNTGDPDIGLGSGTTKFEPFISYGQILPAGFFLQCQAGGEIPFDRDMNDDIFWRVSPGYTFETGRYGHAWSPMVEVLGKKELESGSDIQWDMIPQIQFGLNRRQHILFCFGVSFPVTDTDERDPAYLAYILWDWFDGGLLEGW
jgi:mono/diheme cytochrome c family protein